MAAPGLLLKAEAIVPPPKLIPYLGRGEAANKECELAYHHVLMVMMWSSLAERKVSLMTHALQQMPGIPSGCAWITYVRGHDDIGWAVTEEDAAAVGLDGFAHRAFLSDFYSGRFPGTFARGATFQFNPKTGDRRISGSLASLAGLEVALEQHDSQAIEFAIGRFLLVHNLILVFGGIPVIYMGDEIGMLSDPAYLDNPDLAADNRWMHRPFMDWQLAEDRRDPNMVAGRIFQGLQKQIRARQRTKALHAQAATYAVWTDNEHILGLIRTSPRGRLLVLANFSEQNQQVKVERLQALGFGSALVNQLDRSSVDGDQDMTLPPYQAVWLQKELGG
jgi:amylosucrase